MRGNGDINNIINFVFSLERGLLCCAVLERIGTKVFHCLSLPTNKLIEHHLIQIKWARGRRNQLKRKLPAILMLSSFRIIILVKSQGVVKLDVSTEAIW